jgi:hypothetical protein
LAVAREDVRGSSEAHWRAAAGRAYYALMLETRELLARWGFRLPPRDNVHRFVHLRIFVPKDTDAKTVGRTLQDLRDLRSAADYNLSSLKEFANDSEAQAAIGRAADAIALLDALDADPTRRSAAIAAIRTVFP